MTYHYDVFLSYRRSTGAREWVERFFHPELCRWLGEELPNAPKVFLDSESICTGSQWKLALGVAIQRSKCLVAVLNGPYFSSPYCAIEWHSFVEREALLDITPATGLKPLIRPIRLFDGSSFDETAHDRQPLDWERFAFTGSAFSGSQAYLEFQTEVKRLARDLATVIQAPPPYQTWPVNVNVAPATPTTLTSLPRVA